jgi:carboxyl-terminal processing protease
MPAALRALIAALIVAVVAFGGALYIGYERGLTAGAQDSLGASAGSLASLNLNLLGPDVLNKQLLGLAYDQLEKVYYKPVNDATLVNGEHAGLLKYLHAKLQADHIKPTLPAAPPDRTGIAALDGQLAYAQSHYSRYLGRNAASNLTQAALNGMMDSLGDPYTVYLSPQQIQQLDESLNGGDFGGIGVYIQQLKNRQIVLEPIEGMPAAQAGLKDVEVLQLVNGRSVAGLSLDEVEHLLRGPAGSTVSITSHAYKKSAVHQYRIVRQVIHVPSVYHKFEKPYEYIRLADFGQTSADEVRKALLDGKRHGAAGYILDLRNNGGGLLNAAVDISSFWVQHGPIVTEIDRAGDRNTQYAQGDVVASDTPLVILVNGYTASASEITAGALQDYGIATLVGTQTFGKGVVQGIFTLPNGGALKITTERYVTPKGRDIEHKGIRPNIIVDRPCERAPSGGGCYTDPALIGTPKDQQLLAAKAFLARHQR